MLEGFLETLHNVIDDRPVDLVAALERTSAGIAKMLKSQRVHPGGGTAGSAR